jgi:hypothetical protein
MRKSVNIVTVTALLLLLNFAAEAQVFRAGREFDYTATWVNANKNITTKETLRLTISGRTWKPSNDQKEAVWHYATDRETPSLCKDQFSLGWVAADTTGVIENAQKTWIHPPRHNQYSMNEIAPFPDVRKKYTPGDSYQSVTYIGNGFGPWSGKKVKCLYTVKSIEPTPSDTTWTIHAQAEIEGNTNELTFTFSSQKGFLSLEYSFSNGDRERVVLGTGIRD